MSTYLDKLMPETDNFLIQLRAYAKTHDVPIVTLEGMRFLNQLIQLSDSKHILEIGTAIGYSAISMAKHHDCQITTIERDDTMVSMALNNIKSAELSSKITVIHDDALVVDETTLGTFDMLFIDAAKAQYIKFFEKYTPLLKSGGIVVTDNLLFHGLIEEDVKSKNLRHLLQKIDRFNHYIVSQENYSTEIYAIGDGMSVSIKRK